MDEIKNIVLLVGSGFLFRTALIYTGQLWAKSHAQTVSFLVLPIITYVITNTIANNIALSLGMIGALSIVRFRHPVKSPLELIMYFALITVGIATSVRTKWAIQLIIIVLAVIVGVRIVQKFYKKNNKSFYNVSFNEGTALHMLEVHSPEKLDFIEKDPNLKIITTQPNQNEFVYRLAFENKEHLLQIKEQLEKNKNIKKIDINFV